METEKNEIEEAAAEILKAIDTFHKKLDLILARVSDLEAIILEAEIEVTDEHNEKEKEKEEEEEEEELPCSQPRDVDFWIDREAMQRSRAAQTQLPRAYPWNRKCEWTYK